MKRLHGNLTYANVISTLCLVLLLGGGTAYAASEMLPKGSVGPKQIKKGAVTPAKLSKTSKATLAGAVGPKGSTGAQGIPGPKGDRGEAGAAATAFFAQIQGDGTVNTSGSPVTVDSEGNGGYLVNFGQDITHCVAIANQGGVPLFESPGFSTGAAEGNGARIDISTPATPGEAYSPGFPVADTVAVLTFSEETPNNTSFYIAVFC
jgi:hypothetical protein